MSLSLLKAYASSDESDEEEDEKTAEETTEPEKESEKVETADSMSTSEQFGGKNFFLSDSDDEDTKAITADQITSASSFAATTSMYLPTFPADPADQSSLPPLYGPPHPSQMYNYAGYDDHDDAAAAHQSTSASSNDDYDGARADDETGSAAKRRRFMMTDAEAKKLIKKYECDAWNTDVPDQLNIVEANVDSHLGNVRENLLRNMTKTRTGQLVAAESFANPSSKDGNKPGALAKRKHQITYLAYMAKANEEKLQNEWAKNRMTKKQTQAKYGF